MATRRKRQSLSELLPPTKLYNKIFIPKFLQPKNDNQEKIIDSIRRNVVTFIDGVAGVGKTAISVSVASELLYKDKVNKIILTRPILEAGEYLGHLPGTFEEKINPHLHPFFDELIQIVGNDLFRDWLSTKQVEIVPIAYMRGRTLKNSIVLCDEAQNMTFEQLVLLLTRIGENSKLVINGDLTQSDLPKFKQGGLYKCIQYLDNIPTIGIVRMDPSDIVRHKLIKIILERLLQGS